MSAMVAIVHRPVKPEHVFKYLLLYDPCRTDPWLYPNTGFTTTAKITTSTPIRGQLQGLFPRRLDPRPPKGRKFNSRSATPRSTLRIKYDCGS